MKLEINKPIKVVVYARNKWNPTGIEIAEGEEYEFTATGKWWDLTIKTNADGYTKNYMKPFEGWRRSEQNQWFALIGCVDQRDDTSFLIGQQSKPTIKNSGTLSCFANDVKGFYWNNFGQISLTITRLK